MWTLLGALILSASADEGELAFKQRVTASGDVSKEAAVRVLRDVDNVILECDNDRMRYQGHEPVAFVQLIWRFDGRYPVRTNTVGMPPTLTDSHDFSRCVQGWMDSLSSTFPRADDARGKKQKAFEVRYSYDRLGNPETELQVHQALEDRIEELEGYIASKDAAIRKLGGDLEYSKQQRLEAIAAHQAELTQLRQQLEVAQGKRVDYYPRQSVRFIGYESDLKAALRQLDRVRVDVAACNTKDKDVRAVDLTVTVGASGGTESRWADPTWKNPEDNFDGYNLSLGDPLGCMERAMSKHPFPQGSGPYELVYFYKL